MRPPAEAEIYAPEFPAGLDWLNVAFLRMNTLMGRGAVLVEFWDFARVNSLRTLPYLIEWHARYGDAGLRVIGVHSPGYSFGRDRDTVARAVERLEIAYPVLLDPEFEDWREYGNKRLAGALPVRPHRQARATSTTARASTRRPSARSGSASASRSSRWSRCAPRTCPGVLLEPQTADIVLPADRDRLELVRDWTDGEDWIEAADAGAAASFSFSAGEAYAVLSGGGLEPGLYETDGTVEAETPGCASTASSSPPAPPAPSGSPSGA